MMTMMNRKNIATFCLVLATFLNPIGFDIAVDMVMRLTGSYWTTIGVFYCLSFLFFILYFKLSGTNPIGWISGLIKRLRKN